MDPLKFVGLTMCAVMCASAASLLAMGSPPEHKRYLDVTQMTIVGVGCGDAEQQKRIFIAKEEDDLPGPTCEVVFSLHDPR